MLSEWPEIHVNCVLYLEMLILVFRSCLLDNIAYMENVVFGSYLFSVTGVGTESNGLFYLLTCVS